MVIRRPLAAARRRPRVAILGSGDELVELDRFGEALAGRRVVNTNAHALAAVVRVAGGEPVDLGVAADDPDALAERLRGRLPEIGELHLSEVGAVVGAHVGPGFLGVVVAPR